MSILPQETDLRFTLLGDDGLLSTVGSFAALGQGYRKAWGAARQGFPIGPAADSQAFFEKNVQLLSSSLANLAEDL